MKTDLKFEFLIFKALNIKYISLEAIDSGDLEYERVKKRNTKTGEI